MYKKKKSNFNEDVFIYEKNNVVYSFLKNENNPDYQEYLEWVAEGNEAEEVEQ
jgi:hypothetical protein